MSEQNPFLTPEKDNAAAGGGFAAQGRTVDAGRGIEWLKAGWQLFTKNPGMWIAITVIFAVIAIVLSLIPFIGSLALNFLIPVFTGGIMLGCRALSEDGPFGVESLFAGFKHNTGNLVLVGVFYLIGTVIIMVVAMLVGGGAALTGGMMGSGMGAGVAVGGILLGVLIMLVLLIPLAMAMWFAPALVVFHNLAPLEAMKASFGACLKNIVPFIVYGVIVFVLCLIAALPVMLGFLVLAPVLWGSIYAGYREIFE